MSDSLNPSMNSLMLSTTDMIIVLSFVRPFWIALLSLSHCRNATILSPMLAVKSSTDLASTLIVLPKVLKAKDNDTIVTGRIAGTPVRILKNQMAREYVKNEKAGMGIMELEKFTLGSLRRAVFEGDTKRGSLMAGQVVGQLKTIRPLAEILDELYEGCKEVIAKLTLEE